MKFSRTLAAAAALTALAATARADAPAYTIIDLGRPTGNNVGRADGISNSGAYVAGHGIIGNNNAFVWSQATDTRTALTPLAGNANSWAVSVNDAGVVVGMVSSSASTTTEGTAYASAIPVVWKNGTPTVLNASGRVFSINNAGMAVGSVGTVGAINQRAALYDTNAGTMSVIAATTSDGLLMTSAVNINNSGYIVGTGSGIAMAYDSTTGVLSKITNGSGTLVGATVNDVNNLGVAVGVTGSGATVQPYSWSAAAGMSAVALPTGMVAGTATAINDAGWIVGYARNGLDSNLYPFLTIGGSSQLLSGLVGNSAYWNLTASSTLSITGIGNDGTITGYTFYDENKGVGAAANRVHAFAMTVSAVPETSSYALLLAGLMTVGTVARRRQARA